MKTQWKKNPTVVVPPKPKALSKTKMAEKEYKEEKDREDVARKERELLASNPELAARKKEEEKTAREESDAHNALDLFSGMSAATTNEINSVSAPSLPVVSSSLIGTMGSTLDGISLKTDVDWLQFAELINQKIAPFTNDTRRLLKFLTIIQKKGTERMRQEDVLQLRQSITVIYTEKQKGEQNKKKKNSGKASLNMNESIPVNTRSGGGFTDQSSDYDFT